MKTIKFKFNTTYGIKAMMRKRKCGSGPIVRDPGREPPSFRKTLEFRGDEPVTSITLVRTPINKFIGIVADLLTAGKFSELKKQYAHDELFHLAMVINHKYLLEKNQVLNFAEINSGNKPIKSNSQTRKVVQIPKGLTIEDMIQTTKNYMGPEKYSSYNFESNNCQDFLSSVLKANNIGDQGDQKFIKQDIDGIVQNLPIFTRILAKVGITAAQAYDRQKYGEGKVCV